MRGITKYLCFTLFIVILLFAGVRLQVYLNQQAEVFYNFYPKLFFCIFPILHRHHTTILSTSQ